MKTKKLKIVKEKTSTLTLRLKGNDVTELEKLKKLLNQKNSSTALVEAMHKFAKLQGEHNELKEFSDTMTRQYWDLRYAIEGKLQADKNIQELLQEKKPAARKSQLSRGLSALLEDE